MGATRMGRVVTVAEVRAILASLAPEHRCDPSCKGKYYSALLEEERAEEIEYLRIESAPLGGGL